MTADVQNITQREDRRDDSAMCYTPAVGISNVSEHHEKTCGRNGCTISAAPVVKHGLSAHYILGLRVLLRLCKDVHTSTRKQTPITCRHIKQLVKCY